MLILTVLYVLCLIGALVVAIGSAVFVINGFWSFVPSLVIGVATIIPSVVVVYLISKLWKESK